MGYVMLGALGTVAVASLWWVQGVWSRRMRWRSCYWFEYRYPVIKSDPFLAVGVERGWRERVVTCSLPVSAADTERFAEALAEAKAQASSLNAAERTVKS